VTEEKVYNINERLARIEGRLEEIEKKIESLERSALTAKDLMKYMLYILIIVLSFVGAVLGINWKDLLPTG